MAFVCFAILKAVLTRLLFAGHCLITVCRVVDIYDDGRYWLLLSVLGLLIMEAFFTLGKRKGRELKWFCPSFLIFLCGVVPGIWFLELDRLDRYRTNTVNETDVKNEVTNMYAHEGTTAVTDVYSVNSFSNAFISSDQDEVTNSYTGDEPTKAHRAKNLTLENRTANQNEVTNSYTGDELTKAYSATNSMLENTTAQVANYSNGNTFASETTDVKVVTDSISRTLLGEIASTTDSVREVTDLSNATNILSDAGNVGEAFTTDTDVLRRRRKREQTLIPPPIGLTKLAKLDPDMWVNSIEQSMLLLLIIGRWLLPKGDITRDQLSQLLFVYIGMASDIMELYHLFEEPAVIKNELISIVILGVWSLSLFQFTLVLTTAKKRRAVAGSKRHSDDDDCCGCNNCCNCSVFGSEIWSILVMVFFQDGPFLAVRLYVTITFKLFSYNIIFFTAKNALIVMLQFYRLSVIICHEMRRMEEQSYAAYSVKPTPTDSQDSLTNIHVVESSSRSQQAQRNGRHAKKHHQKTRK